MPHKRITQNTPVISGGTDEEGPRLARAGDPSDAPQLATFDVSVSDGTRAITSNRKSRTNSATDSSSDSERSSANSIQATNDFKVSGRTDRGSSDTTVAKVRSGNESTGWSVAKTRGIGLLYKGLSVEYGSSDDSTGDNPEHPCYLRWHR